MIKCVKGEVEIQGFPWTVMAEMVAIVKTVIKEYGNDAFEQVLRFAMATDDDIKKEQKKQGRAWIRSTRRCLISVIC